MVESAVETTKTWPESPTFQYFLLTLRRNEHQTTHSLTAAPALGLPRDSLAHPLGDDPSDDVPYHEMYTRRVTYRRCVGDIAVDSYASPVAQLVAHSVHALRSFANGQHLRSSVVRRLHPRGLFLQYIQLSKRGARIVKITPPTDGFDLPHRISRHYRTMVRSLSSHLLGFLPEDQDSSGARHHSALLRRILLPNLSRSAENAPAIWRMLHIQP